MFYLYLANKINMGDSNLENPKSRELPLAYRDVTQRKKGDTRCPLTDLEQNNVLYTNNRYSNYSKASYIVFITHRNPKNHDVGNAPKNIGNLHPMDVAAHQNPITWQITKINGFPKNGKLISQTSKLLESEQAEVKACLT